MAIADIVKSLRAKLARPVDQDGGLSREDVRRNDAFRAGNSTSHPGSDNGYGSRFNH
jgi:hypothetical protein